MIKAYNWCNINENESAPKRVIDAENRKEKQDKKKFYLACTTWYSITCLDRNETKNITNKNRSGIEKMKERKLRRLKSHHLEGSKISVRIIATHSSLYKIQNSE